MQLHRHCPRKAFTLVELLVVIGVIAVLAGMILASLSRARDLGQRTACLNNLKQLQAAWLMYADDNDGVLLRNVSTAGYDPKIRTWSHGYMSLTAAESTNQFLVTGRFPGSLGFYIASPGTFRCPSDRSEVRVFGKGPPYPRVRSYQLNIKVGNSLFQSSNAWTYHRLSDIVRPVPSSLITFLDGHENSVGAAPYWSNLGELSDFWVDPVGWRHNNGGTLAFADGHVEYKRWRDPLTLFPVKPFDSWYGSPASFAWATKPTNPDVRWLCRRLTYSERYDALFRD